MRSPSSVVADIAAYIGFLDAISSQGNPFDLIFTIYSPLVFILNIPQLF